MASRLLIALCAALWAAGLSAASPLVPMERAVWREETPHGWIEMGRAPLAERLELVFAVKQQNVAALERVLYSVSDPRSAEYGNHWSAEEVQRFVAPRPESVRAVREHLAQCGVRPERHRLTPNGDFVTVEVTVAEAERVLSTSYALFRHHESGKELMRCPRGYHLPALVASHVDFVAPTLRFPVVQRARIAERKPSAVDESSAPDALFVTPTFLRALYNVGDAVGQNTGNVQAFASFLEQYFSPTDLQTFFKLFQNTSLGHNVSREIGAEGLVPGTEANLDCQYIMSVGANVETWAYYTAGRSPTNPDNEPFLAWLVNMTAASENPDLVSVSYGEDEKSVGYDYAVRINQEFMELGARGITILFAAGDSGTGGNCTASKGRFNPNFPAGSPYVTAVGGLVGGKPGNSPTGEQVDSIGGGGLSDYWPTPSYQEEALSKYLSNKTGFPDSWRYNASGRGYPDIAAQSENFLVVQLGLTMPVAGTSCAAPTCGGVFSLLNDARLQAGKSPLGFLNPLIYQVAAENPSAFNDVTEGYNMGCGPSGLGFPAREGFDLSSGWGSPNFGVLKSIVLALP